MNFDPDFPYLAFGIILAIGSFIQATAGFGFGLFAVPSLILLGIPPFIAIPALSTASFTQSATGLIKYYKSVKWKTVLPMVAFCIPMQFVGIKLLSLVVAYFTQNEIRQAIGLILITIIIIQAFIKPKPRHQLHPAWAAGAAGGFGVLNGLTGMGGPPLVLWVMAHKWSSQTSRLMLWAIFACGMPSNLYFMHLRFDTPTSSPVLQAVTLSLIFLPAVLLGSLPGIYVGNRIPKPTLRKIATTLLILVALYAIAQPYLFNTPA